MSDTALFCPKCGTKVQGGAESAGEDTGVSAAPVYEIPAPLEQDVTTPEEPKKKSILVPVLLAGLLGVMILAVAGVGIYDALRTREFKAVVAQFEAMPGGVASLGKFQSDYDTLLADGQDAASHFRFWQYEGYAEEMDSLTDEVDSMNQAVAAYREEYDSVVQEIEVNGKYLMDDYDADYQSAKTALEEALQEFDEKACQKKSEAFQKIRDKIVTDNQEKAEKSVKSAKEIKNSFSGYSTHPFEEYMIGELTARIESDDDAQDYIQLNDDYQALSEWADKFSAATSSGEQVEKYVQADVSEKNKVKLYINSYDYEKYNFKLEDFIIYEKYNNQWNECQAEDISQIEGMLSMDIVADVSGSMRYEFYDMQCAIEGFVNGTHSDTVLGLSTIGSIYERYQEFTTDKTQITNSVWDLECYGLTSLYQSLYSSVVYTASAEGARCVVAFTDGINEPYGAGYDYDAQDVIDVSLYYQVPVYIIGIGSYLDSSELRNIAESTGGAYYANMTVNDLKDVYMDIYEAQGRMYQLSYDTQVPNNVDRDVYVLYADSSKNLGIRIESELNAEALQTAYASAGFNSDDLSAYYTNSKYLSSDDLAKLGDNLEAVQTIINIYYAKNGYQFGDSENGQKQLNKMINLGVISQNGTLDGDTVTAILKEDPILWQNFSALYNYRYEIIYTVALDVYRNDSGITYEELRSQVSQHYGEENEKRFDPVISAAWKNIRAGQ
jgi:hypothetical protein